MSKKLIKQLFTFLEVITNSTLFLHGLTQAEQEFIEKHLASEEIKERLDNLMPNMDLSLIPLHEQKDYLRNSFNKSGFEILNFSTWSDEEEEGCIGGAKIICKHPQLNKLIIKIALPPFYIPKQTHPKLHYNIGRIVEAELIRNCIIRYNLQHIIVPKKYLYHFLGKDDALNDNNYCVIAEELDRDPNLSLRDLTKKQFEELYKVIRNTGSGNIDLDSQNVFLTKNQKIAIIDTEQCETYLNHHNPHKWHSCWLKKELNALHEIYYLLSTYTTKPEILEDKKILFKFAKIAHKICYFVEDIDIERWYLAHFQFDSFF